ncbi:IPTL-CTERM sorting domain-containing protein [Pseudomonas sp. RIT-PI-AD]|uniref:IPTL-CTERM sorting domain-containing protein n=1 Tax=Pseudomonas sp. RIT-PI-AD TaxID=3035294 RepID=UPI0021D81A73|nr:IPTL-CTERM sorting domain-containing protein [Pseudomonas sp. RIT-PI-AD]
MIHSILPKAGGCGAAEARPGERTTKTGRRWRQGLLSLLLCSLLPAAEAAFNARHTFNEHGNISMVGNTLLTCDGTGTCAAEQNGTTAGGNGNRQMVYVNVDPAAGFNNSSSATLNLPAGAEVLSAGLYWGGRADPSNGNRAVLHLRAPNAADYQDIVAQAADLYTFTSQGDANSRPYSAYADVTQLVRSAGSGEYFAGGLAAVSGNGGGLGHFGGWSLIVVYRDANEPYRRLMVFDGKLDANDGVVSGSTSASIDVTGLRTPASASFTTYMGALVWEGDQNISGDAFSLNGQVLSDSQNPSSNFWNSSISRLGARLDAKTPDFVNQMAIDIDYIDASGILANNASTATLGFSTSGDAYFPHALTFATELFEPNLVTSLTKTYSNQSGGSQITFGDVIVYEIAFSNTGTDGATGVAVNDVLPVGTTFVPGSLEVLANVAGAPTGAQSDSAGNDLAEYDSASRAVAFRLGSGATATNGGLMLPGDNARVRFQVRVTDPQLANQSIGNTASVSYSEQTNPGPDPRGGTATAVTSPVVSVIDALDDPYTTPVISSAGNANLGSVFGNDLLNGVAPNNGLVETTLVGTLPAGIGFDPVSGVVSVAPGTDPGAYGFVYRICERANPTHCDDANVSLTVQAAQIVANDDSNPTPVISGQGSPNVVNLYGNDSLNGGGVNTSTVTLSVTPPAGISVDPATGVVSVAPGTPPGSYSFPYTLCEVGDPDNCDSATVSFTVEAAVIAAGNDSYGPVTSETTRNLGNLFGNDSLNGGPATPATVTLTATPPAGITLNAATGELGVAEGTAPGTYSFDYRICETSDPDNCTTATVNVEVRDTRADLSLNKSSGTTALLPGDDVSYSIQVSNAGPEAARNAWVSDPLPSGLTYVSASPACSYVIASRTVRCAVSDLASGASESFTITTRLNQGFATSSLVNIANVSSDNDPTPGNNSGSAETPVIVDPVGAPTLSEWALILLSGLMALGVLGMSGRNRRLLG